MSEKVRVYRVSTEAKSQDIGKKYVSQYHLQRKLLIKGKPF